MTIWFTADLHFNHNKDFIWKTRGFNSVQEMNTQLIKNFNSVVKEKDTVYILGDIMLSADVTGGLQLLQQLNGDIHIIVGNHDSDMKITLFKEAGYDVQYANRLVYKHKTFWLSHYPTDTGNFGVSTIYNLYGHTHTSDPFELKDSHHFNVGVDAHHNFPIDLDEIIHQLKDYKAQNIKS